jgi:hypothetical protein
MIVTYGFSCTTNRQEIILNREQNSHFCENKYYFADLLNIIVHSLFILLKSRQQKNITLVKMKIFFGANLLNIIDLPRKPLTCRKSLTKFIA